MEIVSTTDTPQQVAAALEAHGFEAEAPESPTAAEAAAEPSAAAPDAQDSSGDAKTAGETDTPQTEQAPQQARKKAKLQDRIDELTREKYQEKGRADHLQTEIEALKAQLEALKTGKPEAAETPASEKPAAAPDASGKPTPPGAIPDQAEFDDYQEYRKALNDWQTANAKYQEDLAEYTRQQAVLDFQKAEAEKAAKAENERRQQAFATKMDEGRQKHADFDAVAFSEKVSVTPATLDAIAECDDPQEILYYLGSHPDEAQEIVEATAYDLQHASAQERLRSNRNAARAVLQIEMRLKGGAPAPAAKPAPRQSQAPAPISPVRGSVATPSADGSRVIGQGGYTAADYRRDYLANKRRA
jgi:hypothetical protein